MSYYRESPPSASLHPFVACRWERRVPEAEARNSALVLPDGCVDLLWRSGELIVAGPDRAAAPSPLRAGETIIGLRLRPGIAGAVLGVPASELLDSRIEASEVLGRPGDRIAARLSETKATEQAYRLLEGAVASQLLDAERPDSAVLAATRRLGFPGSRAGEVSDALGISERQLRRRFHDAVGYGPKTLDRVLRFRRFVAHAPEVANGDADLARIAAELGYADQAHLSRDCVSFSGLTPTALAKLWAS
jgi:AraC-like DNA-binding protein